MRLGLMSNVCRFDRSGATPANQSMCCVRLLTARQRRFRIHPHPHNRQAVSPRSKSVIALLLLRIVSTRHMAKVRSSRLWFVGVDRWPDHSIGRLR